MSDDATTWRLIHAERAAMAETLASLNPEQWARPSHCAPWSVQTTAGHILAGAEQTRGRFLGHMALNGFRFNRMIDRDARAAGLLPPAEIIERLRATTTTTNHPPAPVATMLGEVVVHGEDIRHALGIKADHDPEAVTACFEMYKTASFPVGTKKRIAGLRITADDVDWSHGDGPEVIGPARSLLLVMTGRAGALDDLSGDGVAPLRARMSAPA
jgi:uncharacterized protein (TIGR03083 family)